MKKRIQVLQVFAKRGRKGSPYTIEIHGSGYSLEALRRLFQALEDTQDDDTLMTFPVLADLESPALMKRLKKSLAEAKRGKTISWTDLKKQLGVKDKAKPRNRP